MFRTTVLLRLICMVFLSVAAFAGCTPVPPGGATSGTVRVSKKTSGVCNSLRNELRAYERRGIPYQAEALRSGRSRYSEKQKATIKRYESILGDYLARNCHAKQ